MEELHGDHKLLREEDNQLKPQNSLVIEVLQALLRKEGNPIPNIVAKMITPLHFLDPLYVTGFHMDIIHNPNF